MKKYILISIIIMFAGASFSQNKQKINNLRNRSTISYSASHPMHDWKGISNQVNARILIDKSTNIISAAAVSVPVHTFNSGNSNRDSHMVEVTEAIKYPSITYQSSSIVQTGNTLKLTGKMTFHGVTKIINSEAVLKVENKNYIVTGQFTVLMSEFNIDPPSLLGISSSDKLIIDFLITF